MTRPRVLVTLWGLEAIGRLKPQFEALSRHIKLQFLYYHPALTPDPSLGSFKRMRPPPMSRIDFRAVLNYGVEMLTEADDFDVVYTWNRGPIKEWVDALLRNISGKPLVMKAGGVGGDVRSLLMTPGDKIIQDALDEVALNNCDLIVPISSTVEDKLKKLVLDPSRVSTPVPLGVDTEAFRSASFPREKVVGYAGRISPEKGVKFLRRVMEATPKVRYEVAGRLEMSGFRFPGNSHYQGELDYGEMPGFYSAVSAVLVPSLFEGLGNVTLEAYASGRPVIATPAAHPPELPVFGWELPRDLDQWANLIESLDPREVEEEGRRAREWVCTQWPSWDEFGRVMCEKIMEVV